MAPSRIPLGNVIEQLKTTIGCIRCARMRAGHLKAFTETSERVSGYPSLHFFASEMRLFTDLRHRVEYSIGIRLVVASIPKYTARSRELFFSEKASLTISNRDQKTITYVAIVMEEEKSDIARLGMTIDVDVIRQCVTWCGEITVKC